MLPRFYVSWGLLERLPQTRLGRLRRFLRIALSLPCIALHHLLILQEQDHRWATGAL
jgi:hypothetical protein